MSIWNNLQEHQTYRRNYSDFDKVRVSLEDDTTGNVRPHILDANIEYVLRAAISVTFWANNAQHSEARKIAERHLASVLYGDALGDLACIRSAISDGDRIAALRACDALEVRLLGRV